MIFQYVLLISILALATWYIIRKIREPFRTKNSCGEACGKCQALDRLDEVKKGD